ncbi:hypothetical protein ADEAN_000131400 [Angomonas deanei]|uniref:Uncharacterized protein n=1 Tax=Angomonas deanei TaxID=59799 RepID=A0A7G2C3Y2_9TRYP|nr:hypothetical protein ADEAN_000131400 [Angomonas deanei]
MEERVTELEEALCELQDQLAEERAGNNNNNNDKNEKDEALTQKLEEMRQLYEKEKSLREAQLLKQIELPDHCPSQPEEEELTTRRLSYPARESMSAAPPSPSIGRDRSGVEPRARQVRSPHRLDTRYADPTEQSLGRSPTPAAQRAPAELTVEPLVGGRETPAPRYSSTGSPADLLFNSSAGRVVVSCYGRRLQRLVFAHGQPEELSCSALGSLSHTIYAARHRGKADGHVYAFSLRVGPYDGDLLIGFADRYLPMESFGEQRNSRHYKSGQLYYIQLADGSLVVPVTRGARGGLPRLARGRRAGGR